MFGCKTSGGWGRALAIPLLAAWPPFVFRRPVWQPVGALLAVVLPWQALASDPQRDERSDAAAPGAAAQDEAPQNLHEQLLDAPVDPADRTARVLDDIGQRMRDVRRRLGNRDVSEPTQKLQSNIVAELSELIQAVEQRTQRRIRRPSQSGKSPSGSKQGKGPPRETRPNETQPGETQPGDSPGRPEGGVPTPGELEDAGVEDGSAMAGSALRTVLVRVWGHLPAQVRQQMQSAADEQYLRKHEQLIEAYYRRLAQEPRSGQQRP